MSRWSRLAARVATAAGPGNLHAQNEALERQAAELEQANRMKSEFLATMSHELRTPLNAIIGFAEALHDDLIGELTAEQRDCIGDIRASGAHLLALINDILDLSKVEAGKVELDCEAIDVIPLLANALAMVRERAYAHGIALASHVDSEMPLVMVDGRRIKQIVLNLLSNAVKFTPDGGRVELRGSYVDDGERARLVIAVSDTGIGISADDREKLFRPFVQVDSSLARRFEGTGLGLALVKRLALLHGGDVSIESEIGKGSTFTVSIPCAAIHAEELMEASSFTPFDRGHSQASARDPA